MLTLSAQRRTEERQPLYFGPASGPLFGCYHAPAAALARDCGVVLCYPFGQEYLSAHRSFLQLAVRLAARGFPVLRFDYFGCGDSAGETEEGRIERWQDDVLTAAEELRRQAATTRLCLVGLRLGGSLAALAGAAHRDVDSLVLWDAVINGRAYLHELQAVQVAMLRSTHVNPRTSGARGSAFDEVLGFPLPPALRAGLAPIDLLALAPRPADRVLLVQSAGAETSEPLYRHLTGLGTSVEHLQAREARIWIEEPFRALVPHHLLEAIVAWIARVHA